MENRSVALRGQFKVVLAWLPLLIGTVILAGAAAFIVTSFQPKVYESTTTLIVGQSLSAANPDVQQIQASQTVAATYSQVATTQSVLGRVIAKLGLNETPTELVKRVTVAATPGSTLLTITAKDGDPARAAALANALADELIKTTANPDPSSNVNTSIEADLAAIRSEISDAQAEIETLRNTSPRTAEQETRFETLQGNLVSLRASYAQLFGYQPGNSSNLLSVLQVALPPDQPSAPRPLLNALLGALIGFFIAALIAFVSTSLDD
ncbi:MAG TPA: Wzz/FepE/Etk N-terminal domain-containing protein, partial [Candidatus Acidoferrum sp.]|nr:Wzz/FepE/Etk N-terminal domain-containing protein [Candidatus Acidoferrum sp.]